MYIEGHSRCKMSIEKIKSKMEGGTFPKIRKGYSIGNRTYLKTGEDSVSFTGAAAVATNYTKPLDKFILEQMPLTARAMVKLHEGMGEVQNQIINACGTGLIAPIFIMYNPMSDKDQDTKTYTAMRQPISAVLTVGTQAAIVIPFNAMINKDADIGYLPMQYNRTLFPSDDFIEKIVRKNNPGKKFIKNNDIDELKNSIAEYKKIHYEKPLIDMIENDTIIFNTTDGVNQSTLEIPKDKFKQLFNETITEIIQEEESEKLNAIEKKLPNKIKRGIFYHTYPEESLAMINRLKQSIEYNNKNFTSNEQMIEAVHENFRKECSAIIKDLKASTRKHPEKESMNSEFIKIINEIKRWDNGKDITSLKVLEKKILKQHENIKRMSAMEYTKDIVDYVTGSVYRRTDAIDGTITTLNKIKKQLETKGITVKEAQALINQAIEKSRKQVINKIKSAGGDVNSEFYTSAEWTDSTAARLTDKASSIAKCIAKRAEKHATSYIDGLKRWTGLGVSLAILPLTCHLLNKIYPWFMERAFPGLTKKKPDNSNEQKVEVA